MSGEELLAAVERSLRKRLDDWLVSTSEFYARERTPRDGGQSWREGLISYLMLGPGALDVTVLAMLDERDALRAQVERVRALADGWPTGDNGQEYRRAVTQRANAIYAALDPQ